MTRVRRDLTERALVEKQLRETLRARDEWLLVVSHELRTPLTVLRLSVQSLISGLASSPTDRKAQATERHLQRLERQVEQLIDAADLASGSGLELCTETLDLCPLVAAVIAEVDGKATRLGCVITLETSPPVLGLYDKQRMSQLIIHLLDNALKFGAGTPIEVAVTEDAGHAFIRIVDHGVGIAREDQGRVLGRFERAAPIENYGGFGLGLWVAREIARAHSGNISLAATEGGGTTVSVQLPSVRAA